DRDQHTHEHRLKRALEMRQLELRSAAGNLLELPAKDWSKQRAESEVQKIDDAGRRAAKLRRVRFLDNRVRQHRRTRSDSGHQTENVRWKNTGWSKKYPSQAIEQHDSARDDHRFATSNAIRDQTEQRAANDPAERNCRGTHDRSAVIKPMRFL